MIKKDDMPICEAANYFKEEIPEIMPDVSKDGSMTWWHYRFSINTASPVKKRRR